ncbi:MAG: AAA family ATPase [Pseudonocardiaceae bacterium]|nr:AAA family ATPase [Pseudonocardiaceae bacterium]
MTDEKRRPDEGQGGEGEGGDLGAQSSRKLTPEHRAVLSAISDDVLATNGAYSTPDGVVFPWRDGTTEVVNVRLDRDKRREGGPKCLWPAGQSLILNHAREVADSDQVLLVEGQRQHLAAASYAPPEWSVLGMNGCDGITGSTWLGWAEGRRILIAFDADRSSNPRVAAAGQRLTRRLHDAGAASVAFLDIPGRGTDGLDDVLGRLQEQYRAPELGRWIAAATGEDNATTTGRRTFTLQRADAIEMRPVYWVWEQRIPSGELTLLAGRESAGKSTVAYQLVADITRGVLSGRYEGQPRNVLVVASEDSWEQTIVPRLKAAGADLSRVFRTDITTAEGVSTELSLPHDLEATERAVTEHGIALILLDPLMSRLAASLDSHKDAEVRRALEPMVSIAHRTSSAVLGIIHVNKSTGTDPLNAVMGSRAFTAVARSVLFCMRDPDDDDTRLLGHPKSNLGQEQATRSFTIASKKVGKSPEGEPVFSSYIVWGSERTESIAEVMEDSYESGDTRSAGKDAARWLLDYLGEQGGSAPSSAVREAAKQTEHTWRTIGRARARAKVTIHSEGFPRVTYWHAPKPKGTSPIDPLSNGHAPTEEAAEDPHSGDSGATSSRATSRGGSPSVAPLAQLGLTCSDGESISRHNNNNSSPESLSCASRASRASRAKSPRAGARETPWGLTPGGASHLSRGHTAMFECCRDGCDRQVEVPADLRDSPLLDDWYCQACCAELVTCRGCGRGTPPEDEFCSYCRGEALLWKQKDKRQNRRKRT